MLEGKHSLYMVENMGVHFKKEKVRYFLPSFVHLYCVILEILSFKGENFAL